MFNPVEMMKEAQEAKKNQKLNHDAQMGALAEIASLLRQILAALSAPSEEVKQ